MPASATRDRRLLRPPPPRRLERPDDERRPSLRRRTMRPETATIVGVADANRVERQKILERADRSHAFDCYRLNQTFRSSFGRTLSHLVAPRRTIAPSHLFAPTHSHLAPSLLTCYPVPMPCMRMFVTLGRNFTVSSTTRSPQHTVANFTVSSPTSPRSGPTRAAPQGHRAVLHGGIFQPHHRWVHDPGRVRSPGIGDPLQFADDSSIAAPHHAGILRWPTAAPTPTGQFSSRSDRAASRRSAFGFGEGRQRHGRRQENRRQPTGNAPSVEDIVIQTVRLSGPDGGGAASTARAIAAFPSGAALMPLSTTTAAGSPPCTSAATPRPTLQATALVNEAFVSWPPQPREFANRTHFLAIAAAAIRQLLVHVPSPAAAAKRGGAPLRVTLDDQPGRAGATLPRSDATGHRRARPRPVIVAASRC